MVPRVKDNNPLGPQKTFQWTFIKSRSVSAARDTSKFQNWSHLTNIRRRYMAEILPIRRKIQSNQSIFRIFTGMFENGKFFWFPMNQQFIVIANYP